MGQFKNHLVIAFLLFLGYSCSRDHGQQGPVYSENEIRLSSHKLTAYTIMTDTKYLVVFESGLGDDHKVWSTKGFAALVNAKSDMLVYDRAGYGKSEAGPGPRNIEKLGAELDSVISQFSNNRKVILVGHSLGGMIIRDYAIKNPAKIAGLFFIDPSHEQYNNPTQAVEDMIFNQFKDIYGLSFGGTSEARELMEDAQYTAGLPNLPNIPVVVISSMKVDASHTTADRQLWFDAHELLKTGVSDFTHITTTTAGHYIMNDEPGFVMDQFNFLLSKLP